MRVCTWIEHHVLCSSQDHLETGMRDLDHPILASAENTNIVHLQYQVIGHRAITSKEGPQEG
jgi:hypothetical protein